jgi:hypothetical protein
VKENKKREEEKKGLSDIREQVEEKEGRRKRSIRRKKKGE